jgi:hypothetical protein
MQNMDSMYGGGMRMFGSGGPGSGNYRKGIRGKIRQKSAKVKDYAMKFYSSAKRRTKGAAKNLKAKLRRLTRKLKKIL